MKETVERYLQIIFYLTKSSDEVRSVDIGKVLGLTRPEVARTIKQLREEGYITPELYGKIVLTEKGIDRAKGLIKAHRAMVKVLKESVGLESTDAEENAYRMEHFLTDTAIEKLIELYDYSRKTPQNQ